MKKKLLLICGVLAAKESAAKISVNVTGFGGVVMTMGKPDGFSPYVFLSDYRRSLGQDEFKKNNPSKNQEAVNKEYLQANQYGALYMGKEGKEPAFLTKDGGKYKHTLKEAKTEGAHGLVGALVNVEFAQLEGAGYGKIGFGVNLGLSKVLGSVTESSDMHKVSRSMNGVMVMAGPSISYAVNDKITVDASIYAAMYSENLSVTLQRTDALKEESLNASAKVNLNALKGAAAYQGIDASAIASSPAAAPTAPANANELKGNGDSDDDKNDTNNQQESSESGPPVATKPQANASKPGSRVGSRNPSPVTVTTQEGNNNNVTVDSVVVENKKKSASRPSSTTQELVSNVAPVNLNPATEQAVLVEIAKAQEETAQALTATADALMQQQRQTSARSSAAPTPAQGAQQLNATSTANADGGSQSATPSQQQQLDGKDKNVTVTATGTANQNAAPLPQAPTTSDSVAPVVAKSTTTPSAAPKSTEVSQGEMIEEIKKVWKAGETAENFDTAFSTSLGLRLGARYHINDRLSAGASIDYIFARNVDSSDEKVSWSKLAVASGRKVKNGDFNIPKKVETRRNNMLAISVSLTYKVM